MTTSFRENETRSPAVLHADAYLLFDAVKALKAIARMHAEYGAIERIESDIQRHANLLGIPLTTLKTRYDTYLRDREDQRNEAWIEGGVYDEAVAKRHARATSAPNAPMNKHYPFHSHPVRKTKPEPKPNVASIAVYNGKVESITFNLGHNLPNGVYALVTA